jgi:hypothetical protein
MTGGSPLFSAASGSPSCDRFYPPGRQLRRIVVDARAAVKFSSAASPRGRSAAYPAQIVAGWDGSHTEPPSQAIEAAPGRRWLEEGVFLIDAAQRALATLSEAK